MDNYYKWASYDINDDDNDPTPRYNPSNENRYISINQNFKEKLLATSDQKLTPWVISSEKRSIYRVQFRQRTCLKNNLIFGQLFTFQFLWHFLDIIFFFTKWSKKLIFYLLIKHKKAGITKKCQNVLDILGGWVLYLQDTSCVNFSFCQ